MRDTLGPTEVLVTSAAIAGFTRFDKITLEEWNRYLAVNLTGTFLCLQAALPDMVTAEWGRIVTISSAAGQQGASRQGHYSATKGGVIALTKTAALEYAARGITVNTVPPFIIDTPMLREQQRANTLPSTDLLTRAIPAGRLGTGDDVAALCVHSSAQTTPAISLGRSSASTAERSSDRVGPGLRFGPAGSPLARHDVLTPSTPFDVSAGRAASFRVVSRSDSRFLAGQANIGAEFIPGSSTRKGPGQGHNPKPGPFYVNAYATDAAVTAASTADFGEANAAHTPSPVCLNNQPRASRSRCATPCRVRPAPPACHRRRPPTDGSTPRRR